LYDLGKLSARVGERAIYPSSALGPHRAAGPKLGQREMWRQGTVKMIRLTGRTFVETLHRLVLVEKSFRRCSNALSLDTTLIRLRRHRVVTRAKEGHDLLSPRDYTIPVMGSSKLFPNLVCSKHRQKLFFARRGAAKFMRT